MTVLAGLVYFADVFWGHRTPVSMGLWVQQGVFVLVAAVTAYVASRVTVMGAERVEGTGELGALGRVAALIRKRLRGGVE